MIHTILLIFLCRVISAETHITGSLVGCSDEGEVVRPDTLIPISNLSCVTCLCKNGFVECQRTCKQQDGCFMEEKDAPEGQCCPSCKGCYFRGAYYESDSHWRDPDDPCILYHCKARVVTIVEEVCHDSHCHRLSVAKDSCCSPCKGCRFNGQLIPEDREITTTEDPCLKCICKDGQLTCSKAACPVLQCPPNRRIQLPGQCCPICRGSRMVEDLPKGTCLLEKSIIADGHNRTIDPCTTCTCINGTNICKRQTCPVLTCPVEQQQIPTGECCPKCPLIQESRAACVVGGKTYEDNASWNIDACTRCLCQQGIPRCAKEMCPDNTNFVCPANQKLVHEQGQCCPKCQETDGVCTVFGDPHYRTFDGKFYSFQGSCKYLLSADCVGRSFFIRVTNDARLTKKSAWTKTISMKFGDLKVTLGQKMRVKINGERVKPPYNKLNGQVQVEKKDDSILVTTGIGIKILWNGNSFLEVSAPSHFHNRLCGLCGNYNGLSRDDLMTRSGILTNDTEKFGVSWRVGGRKACDRLQDRANRSPHCAKAAARKKPCTLIRDPVFRQCHSKVNDQIYLASCGMDMCECPSGLCYCEALTAYAHECSRLGVPIGDWQSSVRCPRSWASSKHLPPSPWATTKKQWPRKHWSAEWQLPQGRPPNRITNRPPPPIIQ